MIVLNKIIKKILRTIELLLLLLVVIFVAAVVNKPTEQEKKQKEAKELADKKLDKLLCNDKTNQAMKNNSYFFSGNHKTINTIIQTNIGS